MRTPAGEPRHASRTHAVAGRVPRRRPRRAALRARARAAGWRPSDSARPRRSRPSGSSTARTLASSRSARAAGADPRPGAAPHRRTPRLRRPRTRRGDRDQRRARSRARRPGGGDAAVSGSVVRAALADGASVSTANAALTSASKERSVKSSTSAPCVRALPRPGPRAWGHLRRPRSGGRPLRRRGRPRAPGAGGPRCGRLQPLEERTRIEDLNRRLEERSSSRRGARPLQEGPGQARQAPFPGGGRARR